MSLDYLVKLEMLIAHVLPRSWYRKKLQNLSHRNCGLQIRQIWIQLITECEKYRKRRCKNIRIDLGELKQRLRTEWNMLDHVVIVAVIRQYVVNSSISVMHVLYTFLQYFPHAVINWIQN